MMKGFQVFAALFIAGLIATSSAKAGFVTVNGVKLHYFDWGGSGKTILLLAGFRNTAHVFDRFAPKFTDRFHVLGLTRRGFGESDKPKSGYDVATRVEDIRQFLDARGIARVSLIGHSMAGDEMTLFATLYPRRVDKLVYLDAVYDRNPHAMKESFTDPVARLTLSRRLRMEALGFPEASHVNLKMPPPEEWAILMATMKSMVAFRPDYTRVQAPALAFFRVSANPHYPSSWLPNDADKELRAKAEAWWQTKGHQIVRAGCEQFRKEMRNGKVVEFADADHYLFEGKTGPEVVRKTREFLLK
jgi:pimeloyl-ACP methyl ester carboxylesterase